MNGPTRRRVACAACLVLAVFVAIAWMYFFIVPLACQTLACVLFGAAAVASRRG